MRLQVLSSGSEGNSTLVRAGETNLLVDAGLPRLGMLARMATAGLAEGAIDHVLVTHGHLDHARSAGVVARREKAVLHAPGSLLGQASARRASRRSALAVDREFEVEAPRGGGPVRVLGVPLPHDCDPTLAFRLEHDGRVAVILTDMGRPDARVARKLAGAHVLVLESNWDPEGMEKGPYPFPLRRRITGDRGHLSNAQAAEMLAMLAGAELHTLVLAHLSRKTNTPELALAAARGALARLGLDGRVRVLVAGQDEPLESLEV